VTRIGAENCNVMLVVSPAALQLTAVAAETVTGDGPVIIKSLPLAAIELQLIGSVKLSVTDEGAQVGGVTVPMGIAAWLARKKGAFDPAVTWRLHCPINVLPSVPATTSNW
jgi:hypothetical protein